MEGIEDEARDLSKDEEKRRRLGHDLKRDEELYGHHPKPPKPPIRTRGAVVCNMDTAYSYTINPTTKKKKNIMMG